MKRITNHCLALLVILFLSATVAMAQTSTDSKKNTATMKTYLIEREIPGAGKLTSEELKAISQKSCSVLKEMGPKIQWVQSYVTGNRVTCVYKAESEELIREHAKKGGFPANTVTEVANIISPATAN